MAGPADRQRIGGRVLMALGALLLLWVAGSCARAEYAGKRQRAELQQTPAAVASSPTAAPVGSPEVAMAIATAEPAATEASAPVLISGATITPLPQVSPTVLRTPVASGSSATVATPTVIASEAGAASAPRAEPSGQSAGLPVRITIPDLQLDAKVVEMGWQAVQTASGTQSEWVIPKNEAGHHLNSAQLNAAGNVVISGHNNIFGHVFQPISRAWDEDKKARIDEITDRSDNLNGRTIQLYNSDGERFDYTITAFYRLKDTGVSLEQRINNTRFVHPTSDPQLTLVTCWPPQSNTHRLVVIAQPSGG